MFTPQNIKNNIQTVCLHHETLKIIYRLYDYKTKKLKIIYRLYDYKTKH